MPPPETQHAKTLSAFAQLASADRHAILRHLSDAERRLLKQSLKRRHSAKALASGPTRASLARFSPALRRALKKSDGAGPQQTSLTATTRDVLRQLLAEAQASHGGDT